MSLMHLGILKLIFYQRIGDLLERDHATRGSKGDSDVFVQNGSWEAALVDRPVPKSIGLFVSFWSQA